jgi:LysM repeat protein
MKMKNLNRIISTALLALLFTLQAGAQDFFLHTVTKGQGLYSISRMYGVTEDDIIKLNPGSEKMIKVGEQLRIPNRQQPSSGHFHTIQKGETLYRLSVENRVSIKEICDANPGLSADNFKIGQVIIIPAPSDEDPLVSTVEQANTGLVPKSTLKDIETATAQTPKFKTTHTVARRETIYKLSRMYGITQAEFLDANPEFRNKKLRKGAVVNIPFSQEELAQLEHERNQARSRIESIPDSTLFFINGTASLPQDDGILTAALILPFSLGDTASVDQKKMVEFYQGMLLALEKLKNEKISVNLKVFDSKGENSPLTPLLESGKLDDVDIIFGPKLPTHISEAAKWSTQHKVPLILPMNANADDVFNNPYVYQLNTPQSYSLDEIYNHFFKLFRNPNVIFLNDDNNDTDFIQGLKNALSDHGFAYTSIPIKNASQTLDNALVAGKQNIFIINSSSSVSLNSVLPVLQLTTRSKSPEIETHLFGYPEYQIYASDHLDELYEVDTWFYSWFYTNNMLRESVEFNTSFRRAFSRQMMISYPSFASYGYDTAYYFLKGLSKYGKRLDNNLNKIRTNPVQMGFKFERVNNWGGFINRKIYFVHFSNDFKVEKIDFDK